jgi:hypothetical protein
MPRTLYQADTRFGSARELWFEFQRLRLRTPCDWVLRGKKLLSFRSLAEEPWSQFCDLDTLVEPDTGGWAHSDDPDRRRGFVQLLNFCLREKTAALDLWYSTDTKVWRVARRALSFSLTTARRSQTASHSPSGRRGNFDRDDAAAAVKADPTKFHLVDPSRYRTTD